MSDPLQQDIHPDEPFASLAEAALLNLFRTASLLTQAHSHFFKPFELTSTQYNVLRILRSAHPEALGCGEVGQRMVTPVPDVTRLLDRLEAKGLVRRSRDRRDRRVVLVGIEEKGLALLARIDEPLETWLEETLSPLSGVELERLAELLERARTGLGRA